MQHRHVTYGAEYHSAQVDSVGFAREVRLMPVRSRR